MKIIGLIILTIAFASPSFAQEARKIDEFGNLLCEDLKQRLYSVQIELAADPEAVSYIFVYEGKTLKTDYNRNKSYYVLPRIGEAKNYSKVIRSRFMVYGTDLSRVRFILAGVREKFTVELWIVTKGANPPKIMPTLKKIKHRNEVAKGDFCDYL